MSNRVQVMSEISEGIRCAVCEQRYKPGDTRETIGDMGETAHKGQCPEEAVPNE